MTPYDRAGVAISVSPIEFVARCLKVARFDDEHLAVFIGHMNLSVRRDG